MMIRLCIFSILVFHLGSIVGQEKPYSVVINEILPDPSPIVALPNCEFIELRNCSNQQINLNKWRISNGSSVGIITTDYFLKPDSLVILSAKSNTVFFNAPSKTIGLSTFPSLGNESDVITLMDRSGKTIHAVSYKKSWHDNSIKSEGGWSIEMIDPFKPCNPNNWQSSKALTGGSPGKENSIYNKETNDTEVKAMQCITTNGKTFTLKMNMTADSSSLANPVNYNWDSTSIYSIKANPTPPLFNEVEIEFQHEISKEKIAKLNISNIKNCTSDKLENTSILTGIPITPKKGELVINELLFNPVAYGSDFIEIYNLSNSAINAKEIYIAAKNTGGNIGSMYRCSEDDMNLFPDEYLVITSDTSHIIKYWPRSKPSSLSEIRTMPSYPDEEGTVILFNKQGVIIDEFNYSASMHYPLLIDKEGVSLERIDPKIPATLAENWHSASSTSGYATPTKKNSQYKQQSTGNEFITIAQQYFSPNNDGSEDVLSITYQFSTPGNLISIYIFSFNGLLVNKIVDNQLCGTSGTFIWNGLDQQKGKVKRGIYIIVAESFDLRGKPRKFKQAVAVE